MPIERLRTCLYKIEIERKGRILKSCMVNAIIAIIIGGTVLADIWIVIDLFKIRRASKTFLNDSKKENFEKAKKLLKRVKNILAVTVIIDALCLYRFLDYLRFGYIEPISAIQLTALTVHLIIGIPILKTGNRAERRYLHLYPAVAKIEAPVHSEAPKATETDWDEWFNNSEENKRGMPDKINETLDIMGEPDSELIKYVEGGYQSDYGSLTAESVKDTSEHKECPFCGTLNGIKNEICDFCGADMEAE